MPVPSLSPLDPAGTSPALRARGAGGLAHPVPAGMRDLLPEEAGRQIALGRQVLDCFGRHGYEVVSVPPFEYAHVLEQEMGSLDPARVLRFVEPETGEVVALRPDMTPQIARLISSRLSDAPPPLRLCYEGSVVRRRQERARRDRQIRQSGIELVGRAGPGGDLEVLNVACSAIRAAGLQRFTLDLGHAMVAASLIASLPPDAQNELVQALSTKDADEVRRLAEASGLRGRSLAALAELPTLYGGQEVWVRADAVLAGTPAAAPAAELRSLWNIVCGEGLAPHVVVDLGETWNFAYYTGPMFQLLAGGPGEPVGSGGRYDQLFNRFGLTRSAAGFAIDLGNLGWAIERSGRRIEHPIRVLVSADSVRSAAVLIELRKLGVACAEAPETGDVEVYASAWRFTHVLRAHSDPALLTGSADGEEVELMARAASDLAVAVREHLAR